MKKVARISDANYAEHLSELLKAEPYVPWEDLLSYSNMAVLLTSATGESDFERGLSDTTKWRALRNLSMHGLIPKTSSNTTSKTKRFATEYSDYISRRFAEKLLPPTAIVLWQKGYTVFSRLERVIQKRFQSTFTEPRQALMANTEYSLSPTRHITITRQATRDHLLKI